MARLNATACVFMDGDGFVFSMVHTMSGAEMRRYVKNKGGRVLYLYDAAKEEEGANHYGAREFMYLLQLTPPGGEASICEAIETMLLDAYDAGVADGKKMSRLKK